MPRIIDEAKRREQIAEAVWDIAAEQGLDRATVRAVADRCGLSVGSVQNSFRSQDDLKRFAMELVVQRVTERLEAPTSAFPTSAASADTPHIVAELLMETLPLDAERQKEAHIWAAFSAAALINESLAPSYRQMNDALARFCQACLQHVSASAGQPLGEEALALEALHLQSLLDGLTLSLLADPSPQTMHLAQHVVNSHIERIARHR